MLKSALLRNKHIKKLNKDWKLKKFYSQGKKPDKDSDTVLFWSTGGMTIQTNLEGVIASALKLRGNNVRMILCDSVYTACAKRVDQTNVPMSEWKDYCRSCIRGNSKILERLGIDYSYISELVPKEKAEELRKQSEKITFENFRELTLDGHNLANHLESAMTRHTRGGSFEGLDELLREYAYTVLVNAEAAKEAFIKFKPTKVYMSHGIYADWGPALSIFLKNKIEVISYISSYLTAHFYFGNVRNFSETFFKVSGKYWEKAKEIELDENQRSRLESFLDRRYKNKVSHDMKGLLKEYKGNKKELYEKYGLDNKKTVWGIMTHINWDAVSDYFGMIYKNFDEWLYETVKEIHNIKDVQWLIKIHPSELNDNPDSGCQKFIENNFPDLPSHIKVIKYDDDLSPLDFYNLLDGGVTVMGTGGLELSLKGKPVILAGNAHYSNKGFTYDAKDDDVYKKLLHKASGIKYLDPEKLSLAEKYAYIYFIRKQIPLKPAITDELEIDFKKINSLIPGNNPFFDLICDKIIGGEDFILTDELVEKSLINKLEQIRHHA